MKTNKGIAIIAMVASLILVTGTAAAQATVAQADQEGTPTDQGSFSSSDESASVDTGAGVITAANVSTEQTTEQWAGIFGNATGTLVLGDGTDRLYEWDAVAEYVFASTGTGIDFTGLSSTTASDLGGVLNYGQVSDNATETYTRTGVSTFDGINTEAADTYNGSNSEVWTTSLLSTGSTSSLDNFVFTAHAEPFSGTTAYDGSVADYQAIVPENGTTPATSYNLYMELQ